MNLEHNGRQSTRPVAPPMPIVPYPRRLLKLLRTEGQAERQVLGHTTIRKEDGRFQ